MNYGQTNLMSAAPAPSLSVKANAADVVRPASQTAGAADRGAKNPSFGKMLAKVKGMTQTSAETAEAAGKDPLVASLAASQQTKPMQSAPQTETNAADDVAAVAETASLNAAEKSEAMQTKSPVAEPLVTFAEGDAKTSLPQDTVLMSGEETLISSEAVKTDAATPQLQTQADAVKDGSLNALLGRSEKLQTMDLLQALSDKNLPQASHPAEVAEPLAVITRSDAADTFLPMERLQSFAQVQTNPAATTEEHTVLPDALLRTLASETPAEQPMLFATTQAADGMRRTATVSHTFGETAPLTTTALDADAMLPPSAMDEEMAQNPSEEGFADFLNQQQTAREQKSDVGMTLASSTTAFAPEESSGAKADSAMQIFTDAAQTPRTSQENIVPQVHPGVTFQATLDEAAAAEPTTPMMPQKDYEVARQIVEQARLLRMPEQTEMVIRLKPEHLGELTLKVSVAASGAVNAAFHTDNAAVRAIIETSMIQLKQELQAQGLKVDNVGVYAGLNDSSLMNGQQQDANAYYAQQGNERSSQGRDAQQALASFEEEQQTLVTAGERSGILAQDGVDYRI